MESILHSSAQNIQNDGKAVTLHCRIA